MKKIIKSQILVSCIVIALSGCNNNMGTAAVNSKNASTNNDSNLAIEQKLAAASGLELRKFYDEPGYKIDFADSILVGPQYYGVYSEERPDALYNLKVLKISDNSFSPVYEAAVTCGSSYEGCKVNIDRSKLPADEYGLQLTQNGKIIAGALFYVSSVKNSQNLILDAVSTGKFLKRTYLIPQMMGSSDDVDEKLINEAYTKAAAKFGYTQTIDSDELTYLYYNYLLEQNSNPSLIITTMVNNIKSKTVNLPVNQSIKEYQDKIQKILELNNKVAGAKMALRVRELTDKLKNSKAASKVLDAIVGFASGGTIKDVSNQVGYLSDAMDFLADVSGSKNALAQLNQLMSSLGQLKAAELARDEQTNAYLSSISAELQRTNAKAEIRAMQQDIDKIEVNADILRNLLGAYDLDKYIYQNTQVSPKLEVSELTALFSSNNDSGIFSLGNLKAIQEAVNRIVMDKAITNVDEFLNAVDFMYQEKAVDGANVIPMRRAHNLILSDYNLQLQQALADAELLQKNALYLEFKYPKYFGGKLVATERLAQNCNYQADANAIYECKIKDVSARYKEYRTFITNKIKKHYISVNQDIYGADRLREPAKNYQNLACEFTGLTYDKKDAAGNRIVKTITASCLNGKGNAIPTTLDIKKSKCDYTRDIPTALMNVDGVLACQSTANQVATGNFDGDPIGIYHFDITKSKFLSTDIPVNFVVPQQSVTNLEQFIDGVGLVTPGAELASIERDNSFKARSLGSINYDTFNIEKMGTQQAFRLSSSILTDKLHKIQLENKSFYIPITVKIDGAYYPFYLRNSITFGHMYNDVKGYTGYFIREIDASLACATDNCVSNGAKYQDYRSIKIKGSQSNIIVRMDFCGASIGDLVYYKGVQVNDDSFTSGSVCITTSKE